MVRLGNFHEKYFDSNHRSFKPGRVEQLFKEYDAENNADARGIVAAFEKVRLGEKPPETCTPEQVEFATDMLKFITGSRAYVTWMKSWRGFGPPPYLWAKTPSRSK